MPQFTALSGAEAKSVILAKISAAMDESGEFAQNITYPWFKYDFSLKTTSYPKYAFDAELKEVVTASGEHKDPDGASENLVPSLDDVVELNMGSGPTVIDTPDQARVDAGLPLPTASPVANVGVVDVPVMQAKPPVAKNKGK